MEISGKQSNPQAPADAATAPRQALPAEGKSVQTVEIKAPPKVEKFEPMDLDKAVQELQEFVDKLGRDLSFRRDESIDRSIITVRDTNTNQLVRQIPAEEVVAIARQIREDLTEAQAGMLLKGQV